jgi:membrane-bound lytic murein transglycosylase MltF
MKIAKGYIFRNCLTLCFCLSLSTAISAEAQNVLSTSTAAEREQEVNEFDAELQYSIALQPWKGDYDGMVQRKLIRILVPYSRTHYFLDGATERGFVAAFGRELEREVNRREGLRNRLVRVVFIPVMRSQLIPWLNKGMGDIATGGITITDNHQLPIDFSEPLFRNSQELVVTGPNASTIREIEDLAGKSVYVQSFSSYRQSLERINEDFLKRGISPIAIELIDEALEVDEILEMVHAGLLPITIADSHLVHFWSKVFTDLTVHSNIVVASSRDIGWAFRENSPKLQQVLNEFLVPRRHRTTRGNIIIGRYTQSTNWVKNVSPTKDRQRFETSMPFFRQYGEQYNLDPLLLASLGYQESRINQSVRSPAGAIGVMQILPATGKFLAVGNIRQLEPNIHAGAKYLRYLIDNRIGQNEIDLINQMLFALASYNGGHTRIRRLRREAAKMGLDPDVWFHNVELVAARVIGRETVQYVRNVYMYYLTYRLIETRRSQRAARAMLRQK